MRSRIILLLTLSLIGGCSRENQQKGYSEADRQIQYYTDRIVEHPTNHPIFALLGGAWLAKARETHDPTCLAKARVAVNRSIELLPNFTAYETMAAICNYAHQFPDGLEWGKKANAAANGFDPEVTAMMVESYMGLGQYDEARKLLPPPGVKPADYHTASALGLWLSSQKQYDEALAAFTQAAEFARAEKVAPLIAWAEVSAAGTRIDARQPDPARPHLDEAGRLAPNDINLNLHRAELMELEGQFGMAEDVYKTLLNRQDDPEIHRKAFLVARKLGDQAEARQHFEAAEKGFKQVIVAGEIYTLGSLARLYCDADVNLDLALTLAEQNLQFKRDIEAQTTIACVREKLKARGAAPHAESR